MAKRKRKLEVVVISDIHLGTYGAQAGALNKYLNSIDPDTIIINGDWIDMWGFDIDNWNKDHKENVSIILDYIKQGKRVYYIIGNHDDYLRKFPFFQLTSFELMNELELTLDGKKHWFLHGDAYDLSVKDQAKWIAKLGGKSYDYMIRLDRGVNKIRTTMGREKIAFSKKIKDGVKGAVKSNIANFEDVTCEKGIERGFDYVICGHVHKSQKRKFKTKKGSIMYLNSGDWVENCTSLEYVKGKWNIYYHFK